MAVLPPLIGLTAARIIHLLAAPFIFTAIGWHYFRDRGAREPLPTAVVWTATVALLDLVIVAGLVQRSFEMFSSILGTWLPFALIFLATWAIGELMAVMPGRERAAEQANA